MNRPIRRIEVGIKWPAHSLNFGELPARETGIFLRDKAHDPKILV